jgi:hypothetical protein
MKKIGSIFWITFGIVCICYVIYKIGRNSVTDHLLKNNAQITKAVIIDEKNYNGNENVKPTFSYSYQFEINGKKYSGNSHDSGLKVGDTIEIKYVKDNPSFNKPLNPKD